MKQSKLLKSIFLALLLSASALTASAYDFMVDGIAYTYNSNGTSVTVTSTVPSTWDDGNYSELTTANIPSSVTYDGNTYSVTSIGDEAFYDCSGLTSVTIPNSVTSIGDWAFCDCNGLTSVTIGNSVTSIGDWAFCDCNGLTSVTIPNSVTSIGDYAFYECSGLTSVTIGNSVTSIGNEAFEHCSGLTSITIPNSVTSIGYGAFYGCSGLTSVTIPNSVTSIGDFAFCDCSGLTSVTIPNSVTSIGNEAFEHCSGLTSITIPNSITSIGDFAFYECSGLTSVTIPNSVTTIGVCAFSGCSGLTSVTIPNSVTSIGNEAFSNCSGLTSITLCGGVEDVGNNAFPNINTLILKDSVLSIKNLGVAPMNIYCYSTTPPECDGNSFTRYDGTLHVPEGSIVAYATADYWSIFANLVNDAVEPQSVSLSQSEVEIEPGNTLTLTATVTPSNATPNTVRWTTSNSEVATVANNGRVTAVGFGECDITATVLDKTAVCHVTVREQQVVISLDNHELYVGVNKIAWLTPSMSPVSTDLAVESSNTGVAIAQMNNGRVRVIGVSPGVATVTVSSVDGTAQPDSCVINVRGIDATSISLNINEAELAEGETLQLMATVLPDNATIKDVTWMSNDENVATVSADGLVTALAAGTATITATTVDGSNLTANCAITVVDAPSVIMGDANGDGTVNVSDYVYVANYILEQNPEPFVFAAADIDGNSEINVSDLVLVANIALTYEDPNTLNAPAPKATLNADIDMNATLHKNADGTTTITVDLNNSIDLTALQMDISLPQGMAVTGATLTDRATRSHQAEVAQLSNGNYRLLAASSASKAFKGNEGALLTLTLSGEPQGTVTLGGIKLASPDGQCFTVNDLFLSPVVTGVDDITAQSRIYGEASNIVIESPVNGTTQLVLPNGMSRTVKVKAGRNIYPAPASGLVIVRMNANVAKLFF